MDQHPTPLDVEIARRALADALCQTPDETAAPIRAGMRARAVADACDQLGLAALLIDGTGRVLHVGATARAMMGGVFDVQSGHLVGRTKAANQAIERGVMAAMDTGRTMPRAGEMVFGIPYRDGSPVQLLRGILVLSPDAQVPAGLAPLRDMLPT